LDGLGYCFDSETKAPFSAVATKASSSIAAEDLLCRGIIDKDDFFSYIQKIIFGLLPLGENSSLAKSYLGKVANPNNLNGTFIQISQRLTILSNENRLRLVTQ